jgi:hypothetical protein
VTIQQASWSGSALFALTALAAAAAPDGPFKVAALVVAIGLFLAGCGAFLAGYARAVQRSRRDLIGVSDLFFLGRGVAPPEVRRSLLGALVFEVAVALGTAIARPYTSLAAGILVPVYGLGLCGLWGARHGTFPPRRNPDSDE